MSRPFAHKPFNLAALEPFIRHLELDDAMIGQLIDPTLSINAARRRTQRIRHEYGGALTVAEADALAIGMGYHPIQIWGLAWEDEPIVFRRLYH